MRIKVTADAGSNFEQELQVFIGEAELASQCFHASLAINRIAANDRRIHRAINATSHFWSTVLYSLQLSYIIVLGRLFDRRNTHNVDRLLKVAQDSIGVFQRNALAERKERMGFPNAREWLAEYPDNAYIPDARERLADCLYDAYIPDERKLLARYLNDAYIPDADFFRQLRRVVAERRKTYDQQLAPLRHKVFAHAEVLPEEARKELFDKATLRKLEDLLLFLKRLGYSLRDLFMNGRKPDVEHEFRTSGYRQVVEEAVIEDVERLLRRVAS